MSKSKAPINEEILAKIGMIIGREHLKASQFSKKIGYGKDWASDRINKRTGVSKKDIEEIINAFPEYRKEWLMGEGDHPEIMLKKDYDVLKNKEFSQSIDDNANIEKIRRECIIQLLKTIGYNIFSAYELTEEDKKTLKFPALTSSQIKQELYSDILTKTFNEGYNFKKDNIFYKMDGIAFEDLIIKICDYIELELNHNKELRKIEFSEVHTN